MPAKARKTPFYNYELARFKNKRIEVCGSK
jgi:hypothetical protein